MNEAKITQSIKNFLKKNNYFIIQCIPPGGQGGLNYKVNGRPVYPDIIAFKDGVMIIAENKPDYSEKKIKKLVSLRESENLYSKSEEILNHYFTLKSISSSKILKIELYLGFAESNVYPSSGINFFQVSKKGEVKILKS